MFLLSFAIEDPKKKTYCLKKVLEINPENSRARNRLSKIEKIQNIGGNSHSTHDHKKSFISHKGEKRIHWITYPIAIILFLLIGFITLNQIFPSFSEKTINPTEQPIGGLPPETKAISPTPSQRLTNLPTRSPTAKVTPTSDPTFVPTI